MEELKKEKRENDCGEDIVFLGENEQNVSEWILAGEQDGKILEQLVGNNRQIKAASFERIIEKATDKEYKKTREYRHFLNVHLREKKTHKTKTRSILLKKRCYLFCFCLETHTILRFAGKEVQRKHRGNTKGVKMRQKARFF